MTVRRTEDAIVLAGDCGVEEAETLLSLLIDAPDLHIDLSACGRLHTAVAQVLIAARRPVFGKPLNSFVAERVLPHVLDEREESTFTGTIDHPASADSMNSRAQPE